MECPRCGNEAITTGKKWKYGSFWVEGMFCGKCKKQFKAYYKNETLRFTIPKREG